MTKKANLKNFKYRKMKDSLSIESIRICFILSVPLLPLKGASFTCFRQAQALNNLGFKVTILAPPNKGNKRVKNYDNLNLNGIRVLDWLPPKIGSGLFSHLIALLVSWPFIIFTLIKESPNILHVHNPPDVIPMVVSLINRFFKIPYIFQINDPGPESILSLSGLRPAKKLLLLILSKFFESIIMHHASGIVTVNEVLKRNIIETRKYVAIKPFVMQYHVSNLDCQTNNFENLNNENNILYVGSLSTEILGLENLIRLFAIIWKKYGVKLLIIGDGPLREKLIQTVNSLNAGEYIKILGYVEPQAIPEYLKNAKLCIIPYLDTVLTRVSTPTKVFEYISMGKAVVFPDFPGFTEIFGTDNPGMYLSAVPGDIMRVIENLLKDGELRAETEILNKRLSLNFDFNREVAKILRVYEQVYLPRNLP